MNLSAPNEWFCLEFPALAYHDALNLQHKLLAARKTNALDKDVVLLLEHDPVFTLGRRGGIDNLRVSARFLEKLGIPIIQVERGGDITFHGPGQLVVYPVVDLKRAKISPLAYVERLETVMLHVADHWGIKAERNIENRGIWVGNKKLGSIGIAVKRDISFHGFALNVNTRLAPFGWINACGFRDIMTTSMEQELVKPLSMHRVRESVRFHFKAIFDVELVLKRMADLKLP